MDSQTTQALEYHQKALEELKKISGLEEQIAKLLSEAGFQSYEDMHTKRVELSTGAFAPRKSGRKARVGKKKGKRTVVTDAMKKSMATMLRAGKLSGQQIADKVGVSLGTVNLLKKSLKLTKPKKK